MVTPTIFKNYFASIPQTTKKYKIFLYTVVRTILRMKIVVFSNCKSLPNGKTLAPVEKFSNAIGKFMIGKFLATNGEKMTNPVIGNH